MQRNDAPPDYKALLEKERADLMRSLEELGQGDAPRLTYDQNFADSSQVTAERGEAEALGASLKAALEEIEAALAKIDDGGYGACERCGGQINEARLEAMPATRFCITCAAKR